MSFWKKKVQNRSRSQMISKALAPAKINLTLHVTGQRDDGYHLLDSLVVFADFGDHLTFTPAAQTSLTVIGPFAEGVPTDSRNSVLQAADLASACHRITLEKNLPHGAGIGGGSADAAAVLRHFNVTGNAENLGADVPVCLRSTAQRMQGIGDILTPLPNLPAVAAVLVNPRVHVSTPQIFKALTQKSHAPMPDVLPSFAGARALIDWLAQTRNDLQPPACALAPPISDALDVLNKISPLARMSGSGATCFALFETRAEADRTAATLAESHPDWWVRPTTLS
jgi:4-diphosphocytidyl-2-C-methyl-D-erythritol kinase